MDTESALAKRIHEAEKAGDTQLAQKLRRAILHPTLRDEFSDKVKQEFAVYDAGLKRIKDIDELVSKMGISDFARNMLNPWDSFLYDSQSGQHVDMAKKYADQKQKAEKGMGEVQTRAKDWLEEMMSSNNTPEIVRMCWKMQDDLRVNGETFANYLRLRKKAEEAQKKGKRLEGKELKDWDVANQIVSTAFSGHEDQLAVLTGDFLNEDYRTKEGGSLTPADKAILSDIRMMTLRMAEARDRKTLGNMGERVVTPAQASSDIQEILMPGGEPTQSFKEEFGVSPEAPVKINGKVMSAEKAVEMMRSNHGEDGVKWLRKMLVGNLNQ